MSHALIADFDDALGEEVDRFLIIRSVILQFHDAVETFGAVACSQLSVAVLKGLSDLRHHVLIHSVPERRNDRIDGLATLSPVHHLALSEGGPLPPAVV